VGREGGQSNTIEGLQLKPQSDAHNQGSTRGAVVLSAAVPTRGALLVTESESIVGMMVLHTG
jgi:hypothetical protein